VVQLAAGNAFYLDLVGSAVARCCPSCCWREQLMLERIAMGRRRNTISAAISRCWCWEAGTCPCGQLFPRACAASWRSHELAGRGSRRAAMSCSPVIITELIQLFCAGAPEGLHETEQAGVRHRGHRTRPSARRSAPAGNGRRQRRGREQSETTTHRPSARKEGRRASRLPPVPRTAAAEQSSGMAIQRN